MLLTESPDGELMLRLVVRSTADETRIRKHLPWLLEALPPLRVVSLNVQPTHAAVLEGEREIVLTPAGVAADAARGARARPPAAGLLPDQHPRRRRALRPGPRLGLRARPRVRRGTSTAASAASPWPCTAPGRTVTGVEVSAEAVGRRAGDGARRGDLRRRGRHGVGAGPAERARPRRGQPAPTRDRRGPRALARGRSRRRTSSTRRATPSRWPATWR